MAADGMATPQAVHEADQQEAQRRKVPTRACVQNCRHLQLVIPLALSAFKFILLSHLQVIPRRK